MKTVLPVESTLAKDSPSQELEKTLTNLYVLMTFETFPLSMYKKPFSRRIKNLMTVIVVIEHGDKGHQFSDRELIEHVYDAYNHEVKTPKGLRFISSYEIDDLDFRKIPVSKLKKSLLVATGYGKTMEIFFMKDNLPDEWLAPKFQTKVYLNPYSENVSLIARWETRGKKHWIELYEYNDGSGFMYEGDGMSGDLGGVDRQTAMMRMEQRVEDTKKYSGINMVRVR